MQRNNNRKPKRSRRGKVTRAPVAQNRSSTQAGTDSARYRESERIGTVPGSTTFDIVLDLACNPGLSGSFPWLSGHASLYEKYRVHKLVYRYKNLKGTGSDGNVIMSFDYDTLDTAPTSAVQMCQSTRWIDGAVWRIFELHVPSDNRTLFTRNSAVSLADLKTYDMGRIYVAAEGCSNFSDHGILEVEYDIELFQKQPAGISQVANRSLSYFTLSDSIAGGDPTDFDLEVYNPLNIVNDGGLYTLPEGAYLVTVDLTGSTVNDATFRFELDGQALSPGVTWELREAYESTSAHGVVVSDGTNQLAVVLNSGTIALQVARCRLLFQAL